MSGACTTCPEYLTPKQIANILQVNTETVYRQFSHLEGVIDLGATETMHKRRKRKLRIPRTALNAYLQQKQVKPRRRR